MDREERSHWIAFNRIPRIGRARIGMLESYFGSLRSAWQADSGSLKAAGLDSRSVQSITTRRSTIDVGAEMDPPRRIGDSRVHLA